MFRNNALLNASPTVKSLLVTAFVNAAGTGAFMSGSVLYFSLHLHIAGDTLALTLSACALITLITTVPISAFLERFDLKSTIIFLHIFRGVTYSAYLLIDSVPAVHCSDPRRNHRRPPFESCIPSPPRCGSSFRSAS